MPFRVGQATPIRIFMEALEKLSPVMHMVNVTITYERDFMDHGLFVSYSDEPDQVRVSIEFIVPYKAAKDAGFDEQRELNPGPTALD
jgi:hypothetical protein